MKRKTATVAPPSHRAPWNAELVTIDPGLRYPAMARFSGGRLVAAERTLVDKAWAKLGIGQRCLELAHAAVHWHTCSTRGMRDPTHVLLEWPQVYSETQSGGVDANDLTKILGMASMIVGMFSQLYRNNMVVVLSPTPAEIWGSLKKATQGDPWASPRAQRVRARLDAAELAALVPSHDSIDAVGMGLWALGRFERERVFPGATP